MNLHPSAWGQPLNPHATFSMHNPLSAPHSHSGTGHGASGHGGGSFYDVGKDYGAGGGVKGHTQQPLVTGTSVLGIKYEGGVMLAADNLASYGSLARFRDIQRLYPLSSTSTSSTTATAVVDEAGGAAKTSKSSHTCLAVAGDMSDFQYLKRVLEKIIIAERSASTTDLHPSLSPTQIYEYLSNLMYARRSKMNPLWNAILVGGIKDGETFLGYVDLLGTTYQAPTLATGFGSHFALPLLREAYEKREAQGKNGEKEGDLMSKEEAMEVLDDCMKVLFYRDARSLNKYQIATITNDGIEISASREAKTEWMFAEGLRGYGPQKQ